MRSAMVAEDSSDAGSFVIVRAKGSFVNAKAIVVNTGDSFISPEAIITSPGGNCVS